MLLLKSNGRARRQFVFSFSERTIMLKMAWPWGLTRAPRKRRMARNCAAIHDSAEHLETRQVLSRDSGVGAFVAPAVESDVTVDESSQPAKALGKSHHHARTLKADIPQPYTNVWDLFIDEIPSETGQMDLVQKGNKVKGRLVITEPSGTTELPLKGKIRDGHLFLNLKASIENPMYPKKVKVTAEYDLVLMVGVTDFSGTFHERAITGNQLLFDNNREIRGTPVT